jgi:carbon monoxide dehydrogenase subunit G
MANYNTTVESPLTQEEAFDYLADFRNAAEWDSNTVSSELLTGDPYAVGARYQVVTEFGGRKMTLTYETVELVRPSRVVLETGTGVAGIRDTMNFAPSGTGSRVNYDADISLKSVAKVFDPVFSVIFKRVGDRAAEGLRAALKAE